MKIIPSNTSSDHRHNPVHYSVVLLFCSLWLGAIFFTGCENDEKQIRDLTEKKILREEAISIVGYLSQEGKMKAKLRAPLMYRVAADTLYVEFPNSLHVDFYDDSAHIESRLDSKYGKYFENLGKVYLRDSVIVINTKGDTLRALDLWWDQNTRLFYSDKYTQYNRNGDVYYGNNGMEATQDLTRFTLKEGGGKMKVSESGFPE